MPRYCLFVIALFSFTPQSFAQSGANKPKPASSGSSVQKSTDDLRVTITHVYSKGAGVFDVDIKVEKGKLKVGEEVDIVDSRNTRYQFKITSLRTPYNEVQELAASEATNYALIKGSADAKFDADFVMVRKGQSAGNIPTTSAKFIGTINQKSWKGGDSYGSFGFLKKGSKVLGINKPLIQLAFKSMDPVDDRQLTIWIFTSDAKPGTYSGEKIEVLLSGSATGDKKNPELWGYKYPANKGTSLQIEISSYKENANGKATLSGSIRGNLVKTFASKTEMAIEGTFKDLIVDVYTTNQ